MGAEWKNILLLLLQNMLYIIHMQTERIFRRKDLGRIIAHVSWRGRVFLFISSLPQTLIKETLKIWERKVESWKLIAEELVEKVEPKSSFHFGVFFFQYSKGIWCILSLSLSKQPFPFATHKILLSYFFQNNSNISICIFMTILMAKSR